MTAPAINLTQLREDINEQLAHNPTAPYEIEADWLIALIATAEAAQAATRAYEQMRYPPYAIPPCPLCAMTDKLWIAHNGYLGYNRVHAIVQAPDEQTARQQASDALRAYADLEDKDQFATITHIQPLQLPYVSD